jgi:ubiquinone/menaquinone biosynthesis C-methylase UbiE
MRTGTLRHIVTPLHKRTSRDYLARMVDDKIHCMEVAKKYDKDYWDGDRRYGYGGYSYDGRWKTVAESLIQTYKLTDSSKILDAGCGKAFLLYEIKQFLPGCTIAGFDTSSYGLAHAQKEIRSYLFSHKVQDHYPYNDKEFDLVISLTTLHNLEIQDLANALSEVERVGKQKYIVVESYRNDAELFNLECWALTCAAFFSNKEWIWLFKHFQYTGDYEFIYFQ